MLAVSGGRLVALPTPFGTRGWWYEEYHRLRPWIKYEVRADENPRIAPSFLEEEKASMGEWWYEQEYMCRFLDAKSAASRREDIDAIFSEEVTPWAL